MSRARQLRCCGDWMAFLFNGGKARQTKFEIAHNNGVSAEVRSGLTAGQRVILHAPNAVADGAKVEPRTDSERQVSLD